MLEEERQVGSASGCSLLVLRARVCGLRMFLVWAFAALGRTSRSAVERRRNVLFGDEVVAVVVAVLEANVAPGIGRPNWSVGILLKEMCWHKKRIAFVAVDLTRAMLMDPLTFAP